MLILALDCSTARGSVALAVGSERANVRTRWRAEFPAGRGHGGELFTTLERLLAEGRRDGERLTEIIVGLGPGSYSGVRQAIAAAVGLALATGAKLRGCPSTAALATDLPAYQAVSDARRGTYYHTAAQAGRCVAGPALLPDLAALRTRLDERSAWPVLAVENVPPGLSSETPVAVPAAERLFACPAADLVPPPLEPIYLRPVTITLPKTAAALLPTPL